MAATGLGCCPQTVSSRGKWGLLFVEVHGFLIVLASLVVEHRRGGFRGYGVWVQ